MNRFGVVNVAILFATTMCYGQASSRGPAQVAPGAVGHGAFPAKIVKTLDSSKLKAGDPIEIETAGSFKLPDGTLVPKGSKLLGRVVVAKARSKGDADSELTLSFEKLNVTKGKQLSLKGTIQAVYPPPEEQAGANMATAGTSAGGNGAGGSPAGVGLTDTTSGSNTQSSSQPGAVMNMSATGVQGIDNLQLDNGILMSKGKNVKLGSGVRIIVEAEILGWSDVT